MRSLDFRITLPRVRLGAKPGVKERGESHAIVRQRGAAQTSTPVPGQVRPEGAVTGCYYEGLAGLGHRFVGGDVSRPPSRTAGMTRQSPSAVGVQKTPLTVGQPSLPSLRCNPHPVSRSHSPQPLTPSPVRGARGGTLEERCLPENSGGGVCQGALRSFCQAREGESEVGGRQVIGNGSE
ncbi:hypothetical protein HRbin28_01392 [bacterium HR28]|nr:hypothetical protein HRbin28_01392 [bacterium HR28]